MAYVPPHRRRCEQEKSRKIEKAGIIPCQKIGETRCILLQISYSHKLYDYKVDPLRGTIEEQETKIAAAIREAKEESAQLIRFNENDLANVFESEDIYYIHVQFGDGGNPTAQQLPWLYSANVPNLNETQTECLETKGLYWLDIDSVDKERKDKFPRISGEIRRALRTLKKKTETQTIWDNIESTTALRMFRDQADNFHFYSSTKVDENDIEEAIEELTHRMNEFDLDQELNDLENSITPELWGSRKEQLKDYPQDAKRMLDVLKRRYDNLSEHEIREKLGLPPSSKLGPSPGSRRGKSNCIYTTIWQ